MNPSVLIFVALAVAWLAYLVPKALEHSEVAERTRAIAEFSHRLRVLGRREPVAARVAVPAASSPAPATSPVAEARPVAPAAPLAAAPTTPPPAVAAAYMRRAARARATRRRRRVLGLLLVLLVVVGGAAYFQVLPRVTAVVPVALLVAWLVACRLMVRREAAVPVARRVPAQPLPREESLTHRVTAFGLEEDGSPTQSAPVVEAPVAAGGATADGWDPVDVPLPTYVAKPAARRAVRTIDLDGTGIWSSGRNESDSALARSADAAREAEKSAEKIAEERRRTGS